MPTEVDQALYALILAACIIAIIYREKIGKLLVGPINAGNTFSGFSKYLIPAGIIFAVVGAIICYNASVMTVTVYAEGIGEIVNASLIARQSMEFQQGGLLVMVGVAMACVGYVAGTRKN